MSILAELNTLLTPVLPVETGVFSGVPPDEYLVLTPMTDEFALFGDNCPLNEVAEVRISLFPKIIICKGNGNSRRYCSMRNSP